MPSESRSVRRELRQAGITARAIDAAWPEWWSSEADHSSSATAELRYTLARRLGLSPRSLFEGQPTFLWRDEAKFKRRTTQSEVELAALTSFGVALAQTVLEAARSPERVFVGLTAKDIRSLLLQDVSAVGLTDLLALAWGLGIPVLQLAVFPLAAKRMHAMTARSRDRYVILLGYRVPYLAQVAYTIAHELGHILLGHVVESRSLVELQDPARVVGGPGRGIGLDAEEVAADRFALELLTGTPDPEVVTDSKEFSAAQLAEAVLRVGPTEGIDPGVLALCLGHSTGRWRQTIGALKKIPPGSVDVAARVNGIALQQLDLDSIAADRRTYLLRVMGAS